MRSASSRIFSMSGVRRATAALAVLFVLLAVLGIPASAQRPNGAGVVVRHGDGTLIMAYVQFEGESISADALLEQTGLQITAAPYGGLGTGICMIDNEGCPADNCYCESYDNPAEFWHYYSWDGAGWVLQPFGPSSREIHDGDIDGWSWTGGEHGLPAVSIEEIASLNGVDRNPPTPTPPPPPTETPVPPTPTPVPPTATPEPTATQPPPPTAVEPSPSPAPTSTPPPQPTDAPTATTEPTPSATPTAPAQSPTATPSPTAEVASTASPTESDEARAQSSPSPTVTATEAPTSVAVIITPGSTPQALVQESRDDGGSNSLLIFGLMAGVVVLVGGGIAGLRWRRQG